MTTMLVLVTHISQSAVLFTSKIYHLCLSLSGSREWCCSAALNTLLFVLDSDMWFRSRGWCALASNKWSWVLLKMAATLAVDWIPRDSHQSLRGTPRMSRVVSLQRAPSGMWRVDESWWGWIEPLSDVWEAHFLYLFPGASLSYFLPLEAHNLFLSTTSPTILS